MTLALHGSKQARICEAGACLHACILTADKNDMVLSASSCGTRHVAVKVSTLCTHRECVHRQLQGSELPGTAVAQPV